jgi:RNA polymerase sigma factor (TIGR02999 family)
MLAEPSRERPKPGIVRVMPPAGDIPLTPDLYAHLRALAGRVYYDRRDADLTLQPTALVHEAWMKLAGHPGFESRLHFFRAAALAMRQILVDHERARRASKRGGDDSRTTLSGLPGESLEFDLLELDLSLHRLQELDPEAAEVVVLRCFGGLTLAETAQAIGLSDRTVSTRWRHARAWLLANLGIASPES